MGPLTHGFQLSAFPDTVLQQLAHVPPLFTGTIVSVLAFGLLYVIALLDARKKSKKPALTYQGTAFNEAVLSRMPTLRSVYKCLPFLTNGHVETIWAAKTRRKVDIVYRREVVHVADGGVLCLDWRVRPKDEAALPADAPVVIFLPGLTGGSDDSYIRYAMHYAETHGARGVVFNSRGTGDTPLTTPQFYSGLYIGDMQVVVEHVRAAYPESLLFAAGWSLGANILVNYLALTGASTALSAAAALCNPFNLTVGIKRLEQGFNRVYDRNLARSMSQAIERNRKVWNGVGPPFDVDLACNSPSVRAWDDAITRVTYGFDTVDDYYAAASSHQRVSNVKIPLLVIQAEDDPIAPIEATPKEELLANPNCILAVTKTGGHLGWTCADTGYFGEPWTDRVVIEWCLSMQIQIALDARRRAESVSLASSYNASSLLQRTSPGQVTAAAADSTDGVRPPDAPLAAYRSILPASNGGKRMQSAGDNGSAAAAGVSPAMSAGVLDSWPANGAAAEVQEDSVQRGGGMQLGAVEGTRSSTLQVVPQSGQDGASTAQAQADWVLRGTDGMLARDEGKVLGEWEVPLTGQPLARDDADVASVEDAMEVLMKRPRRPTSTRKVRTEAIGNRSVSSVASSGGTSLWWQRPLVP